MFHYKTQFCPYSHIPHSRSGCVYAHNWQDLRRCPYEIELQPIQCPYWKQREYLHFYSEGCPNGLKCGKCHGWKEIAYHPHHYKVNPCDSWENCLKKFDCPFYHSQQERRYFFVFEKLEPLMMECSKIFSD
jgi:hypothetical protein